jgi:hypothetical protein
MADLGWFRGLGAALAIVFAMVQAAAMIWEWLPATKQAAILRWAGERIFSAGASLQRLAGGLLRVADGLDEDPPLSPPPPSNTGRAARKGR